MKKVNRKKESSWQNVKTCNNPIFQSCAAEIEYYCPNWIKLPILFELIYKNTKTWKGKRASNYEITQARFKSLQLCWNVIEKSIGAFYV